MTDPASWPAPGDAHVFCADVGALKATHDRLERWLDWLTPADQTRFDRFRHEADRLMFLCGRGMARELVGRALGVAPGTWGWRQGAHGRPEIDGPDAGIRFNVAHSAGLIVCGIARGREIGVDVEDRRRRQVEPDVVRRYCSPAEIADVTARGDHGWHDRFLEYWTLKEAYLKARGLGIALPLSSVSFTIDHDRARVEFLGALAGADTNWTFTLFRPSPHHIAAAATDGVVPAVHAFA